MKLKHEDIWPVIVGFLLIMTIGLHLKNIQLRSMIPAPQPTQEAITTPDKQIMSIREMQTFLRDTGNPRYDIGPKGVDGKLGGPESATRKAWDNYICDRQASKEFE